MCCFFAPDPERRPWPRITTSELLINGWIAQSIKKEVAPPIFFIQTIHNVLSSKWIKSLNWQWFQRLPCQIRVLSPSFSFIIPIETLFSFSDIGAEARGGEGCPLLRKFFSIYSHLFLRDSKCIWNVGTGFEYTGHWTIHTLMSRLLWCWENPPSGTFRLGSPLIHCTLLPSPRLNKFPWKKLHRIYSKVSHTFRQFFFQVNCQPSPLFWISWHVPESRLFVKNKKWTTVI